ncbi:A49 RNA polymerase I associated factor [Trichostrongylus colubriformis]|uniref:A49 RNA polymerase I associated factor n=1 Tax=Trichostrongylus colubriformis TaxID=6319 RepID=A0AAN8FR11_TRICO
MLTTQEQSRRNERVKLKRKSAVGRNDHDILACFGHNRIIDATKLSFMEHWPVDGRRGGPSFTIKTDVCENVVEIGKEISNIEEGYDYAIAIVDRETGATTYRPVRLYNFQATYSSDIPQLTGEKRNAPVDYSASYDIKTEDWAKKRMDLTADFGSLKKLKIQEASIRRQINTETLDAMRKTAFASTSVLADTEDIKKEQISLVVKAESSILPPAHAAELPRDIYPLSTFIREEEIEVLSAPATEFLSSSKKELLEKGCPDVVVKMLPSSVSSDPSKAVAFTLLGCMTYMTGVTIFAQIRSES